VRYLDFFNLDTSPMEAANRETGNHAKGRAFFYYSAKNWGFHFRKAHISNGATVSIAMRHCDPGSRVCSIWWAIYWRDRNGRFLEEFSSIMIPAYFGHEAIVQLLLANNRVHPDLKDTYGRTPLWWAARNGHEVVVKLLLANDRVDQDSKDKNGRTPLWWAIQYKHEAVVKMLRQHGIS
jgi:hypothetical protein